MQESCCLYASGRCHSSPLLSFSLIQSLKTSSKNDPQGAAEAQSGWNHFPRQVSRTQKITSEVKSQVREAATVDIPAPQPTSDAGKEIFFFFFEEKEKQHNNKATKQK